MSLNNLGVAHCFLSKFFTFQYEAEQIIMHKIEQLQQALVKLGFVFLNRLEKLIYVPVL